LELSGIPKKTTETDNTTCKNPKFSPSSGTYNPDQLVSIQCGTEDAEIHYTVDMTEPDLQSPLYTQPLVIPDIFINFLGRIEILVRKFGKPVIFEHGAKCSTGGGCGIYHAHLHVVPLPERINYLRILPEISKKFNSIESAFKTIKSYASPP